MNRSRNPLLFLAALIAVVVGALWQRLDGAAPGNSPPATTTAAAPAAAPAQIPSDAIEADALDRFVPGAEEREQLIATLARIESGGPYPYDKDGSVFANRERLLPQKPRGYYREYTVPTPNASSRGARRVVRGREGETYYTRDHYRSFIQIGE